MIFKQKKKSTRKLLNLKTIEDNYLQGYNNHTIFYYQMAPYNLSVLSEDNIHAKVFGMMNIIRNYAEIEILVLNNRENYGLNKEFLKSRIHEEHNQPVRNLLQKDLDYIDKIQVQTATARSFLIGLRIRHEVDRTDLNMLASVEKAFMQNGFLINKLSKEELKTLLAVYYEQNVTSTSFEDKDGKRWFKKENIDLDHVQTQSFLDMVTPGAVKFNVDHFILGNTYRSVWAIRQYPTQTEEQALLRHLGDKENVSLRIYSRVVTPMEERKIILNATNKNRMKVASSTQAQEAIVSQADLIDLNELIADMHRSKEPLVHTAVFIEMMATSLEDLKIIEADVFAELSRSKINVDKLLLRQKEGLLAVSPSGYNLFRDEFERVMPAKSVANLFPFNYSGKTDDKGFSLGQDVNGTNIIVDFDKRTEDKTNSNIIILGNSGQGKSYLLKLININLVESGKNVIILDPESEYDTLTHELNGDYIDLTSGQYIINVLEPKLWNDDVTLEDHYDEMAPDAFKANNVLSQHISFLKDFFKSYKQMDDAHIDTIEIMLKKLYDLFEITDDTNIQELKSTDFPILEDLYELIDDEFKSYDHNEKHLYSEEILREILLSIYSIAKGAESKYFNGHTNIKHGALVTFGVKGLLNSNENLKNALLFNVLSYMSNELLTKGNTVGSLDEFYLFLTNLTAVEYIRNFMKRVRKKDSSIIIASQNLEDFNIPKIREYTKPLFSIPAHQFLFNAGAVDRQFYIDTLQLEESEFNLIQYPQRGVCLYKCGNERYHLKVIAPKHKEKLFGDGGGR